MSVFPMRWTAVPLALAIAACQLPVPEGPPDLSPEDVAAIDALPAQFTEAVLTGAWADLAALYTEDAVRMPPNQTAVEGRAAIQAALEQQAEVVTELTITPLVTAGLGDLAYQKGTYSAIMTVEGSPEPISDTGKYLFIARKQPDGSWLMTEDIWNSDLPLAELVAQTAGQANSG